MTESVSVIIPAYNAGVFLADCLDSLQRQSVSPDEIIVVDDGSEDDPAPYCHCGVTLLRQPHRGLGAARNTGADAAASTLLAFLDADDVARPDWLERSLERFGRQPSPDMTYCALRYVDRELKPLGGGYSSRPMSRGELFLAILRRNEICVGSSVIYRECFREHGGFDETRAICEDYGLLLSLAGWQRIEYIDEYLVDYRRHEGNISNLYARDISPEIDVIREFGLDKIEQLAREVGEDPFDVELTLGQVFSRAGELDRAITCLENALDISPNHPEGLFFLGTALTKKGDHASALEIFNQAMAIDQHAALLNNTGIAQCAVNQPGAARQSFTRALELFPGYRDAAHNLQQESSNPRSLRLTERPIRQQPMPYQ